MTFSNQHSKSQALSWKSFLMTAVMVYLQIISISVHITNDEKNDRGSVSYKKQRSKNRALRQSTTKIKLTKIINSKLRRIKLIYKSLQLVVDASN